MADEDSEWKFELSDLPPLEGEAEAAQGGDDASSNVAGTFVPKREVEPETPELENAAFVLLGAVVSLVVFLSPIVDYGSLGTTGTLVVLAAAVVVGTVFYRLFWSDSQKD